MPKQKPSIHRTGEGEPQAKKARFKSNRSEEVKEEEEEEVEDNSSESFNLSQSSLTAPFDNREAEYGIIEKVSLKNFLCHGRRECELGPNVNFIVGPNGSGKSAILTAIVVGLGGKAIVTESGNSVKSFIKTGKNIAEIVIKLRNRGKDSYRPKEYGSSIIVERKLHRERGTMYKLKAANGKVISNKREELSHILNHFNIQVDSPVSIMDEDTSRSFLLSKNSKDLYKLFLKATQLEQMSNDYKQMVEDKESTEESINSENEKLPALKKKVLVLEQKCKDLTCLKDLKNKKTELYSQLAWALVAEEERVFESKKTALQKEESRLPTFDEKIDIQQAKVLEERHSQIRNAVLGLRQRLEELSPQHALASETRQKLKQTVKTLEKEIKQRSAQICSWESDRDDILARIQEEKARKTREELKKAEQAMEELNHEIQNLRQIEVDNERLRKRVQQQRNILDSQICEVNDVTQLENEGDREEETNIADLETEVQQVEAKINKVQGEVERRSCSFKTAQQQLQKAQKRYESFDEQFQEISEQVDHLKDDLAQVSIEVQTAKQHHIHHEDEKRNLMKTIDRLRREADKHEKEVEEAIARATQICPERLKVTRKAHTIDNEIRELDKRIRKKQMNQEITKQQYNDARKQYDAVKEQIKDMKKYLQSRERILEERYVAYRDMRRFIAQRTKYCFITMMSTRGYNGQFKFDHKNCDLILTVSPGQNSNSGEVSKDVHSLSGGERSFSTVCLIMALWESIGSPFRAMDEFDVFMDMMNRKICMELMLQCAKDDAIRQFIFFTRQDMSEIQPTRFVRILRLHADPERNQGVLTADTEQTQGEEWEIDD